MPMLDKVTIRRASRKGADADVFDALAALRRGKFRTAARAAIACLRESKTLQTASHEVRGRQLDELAADAAPLPAPSRRRRTREGKAKSEGPSGSVHAGGSAVIDKKASRRAANRRQQG